ncbi:copper-binding protein [Devosia sp.]|uniref:copper-binding protein n=1 Tax=Devosia sp. TaxID=1871048 RepID=UPI0025DD278C|nr:copper-binding protein [Devosia sp.]MCR6634996.1 copper-binding protein [Devosia sp.]
MRKLILAAFIALLPASAMAATVPVQGEVKKINEAQGKITLKHEAITNLGMDGMTMVFSMADPTQLKSFAPGDRVVFEADRVNGKITVVKIEPAN